MKKVPKNIGQLITLKCPEKNFTVLFCNTFTNKISIPFDQYSDDDLLWIYDVFIGKAHKHILIQRQSADSKDRTGILISNTPIPEAETLNTLYIKHDNWIYSGEYCTVNQYQRILCDMEKDSKNKGKNKKAIAKDYIEPLVEVRITKGVCDDLKRTYSSIKKDVDIDSIIRHHDTEYLIIYSPDEKYQTMKYGDVIEFSTGKVLYSFETINNYDRFSNELLDYLNNEVSKLTASDRSNRPDRYGEFVKERVDGCDAIKIISTKYMVTVVLDKQKDGIFLCDGSDYIPRRKEIQLFKRRHGCINYQLHEVYSMAYSGGFAVWQWNLFRKMSIFSTKEDIFRRITNIVTDTMLYQDAIFEHMVQWIKQEEYW